MKRSSKVSLVMLTSISALAVSGCEEVPQTPPDNGGTFASKAECVAVYDEKTCDAADKLARSQHLNNAPKFNTRAACIAEYGEEMCQPASAYGGSGDFFMPMMIGYMMGSALSTPAPLYYGPGSYRERERRGYGYSAPIYSSGKGYSRSTSIGSAPYYSSKSSSTTKGSLKSSTALTPPSSTRGGFGSTFKPTNSFKSTYASRNPKATTTTRSYSSRSSIGSKSSYSSSRSSRGGFGSSARGFSGG